VRIAREAISGGTVSVVGEFANVTCQACFICIARQCQGRSGAAGCGPL